MLGEHALKAYTRKQKIIARSNAEAELYAAALGASESKGIVSLLRDLGYAKKPVLAIDAQATEHILHRQGIGKLKHKDVAYLWIQDEIRSHRVRVRRFRSEDNVADLGTKPLSKAVIAKHCLALGYVHMNQDNVQMDRQIVAMFLDFGSAVSSQQQAAGDHVQRAASREPQQQKHPQHSQQRQAGQELVPWIPTNPDGVMHRFVDNHYAMDPMRRSFDRDDGALKSTVGSSEREKTYEMPDGNVFNIDN